MIIEAPWLASLIAQIRPSNPSTICLAIARPKPLEPLTSLAVSDL